MKTFALLVTLISFSSLGEILSAHGMKQVGEVSFSPRELLRSVRKMMGNISLLGGVACMAVSFFSFLSLLSFADLSFVVPLTAVSYITNTIGSRFLLGERDVLVDGFGAAHDFDGAGVELRGDAGFALVLSPSNHADTWNQDYGRVRITHCR